MISWTAAAAPFGPPGATLPRATRCLERPWACRFPQGLQLWPRESPRCRLPESFRAPSRVDETALNAKCPVPLPLSPSPNWRGAVSGWTGPGGPRSFRRWWPRPPVLLGAEQRRTRSPCRGRQRAWLQRNRGDRDKSVLRFHTCLLADENCILGVMHGGTESFSNN
jgi:hypothetical protein